MGENLYHLAVETRKVSVLAITYTPVEEVIKSDEDMLRDEFVYHPPTFGEFSTKGGGGPHKQPYL